MSHVELLWRDQWLMALHKPSGLPSAPTRDPLRRTVYHEAKALNGGEVWVAHRLDLGTSGVILLSARAEATRPLCLAFEERRAQKLYWALCATLPEGLALGEVVRFDDPRALLRWAVGRSQGDLSDRERSGGWLHLSAPMRERSKRAGRKRLWEVTRSGGRPAHTEFKALATAPGLVLIASRPQTGRTHQIRVHLAHLGAPIIGDQDYGGARAPRLMLHARSLELTHPMTGEALSFQAPCSFK